MELNEAAPTEFNLKEEVIKGITDKRELFSTIELVKNHLEQNKANTYFTESELNWLRYRIEFVPLILESQVGSGVIYWLEKDPGTNPYIIAKRLGVYYRAAEYWFKKLQKNGLIVCSVRMQGMGNSNRYYLNKKVNNVIKLTLDLIHQNFGANITKIMMKNDNKQFTYIKKWRSSNPDKVKEGWRSQNKKRLDI
jgi:hypothetical protein